MHISVQSGEGYTHQITSTNPKTIGAWFAELAPMVMSANALFNHPMPIDVWPMSDEEIKGMLEYDHRKHGKAAWLELINFLTGLVDTMPDD